MIEPNFLVLSDVNWLFLGWFILYLTIVLGIGVWGWRQVETQADFATTDRSLGPVLGIGTMFASFMSALTVIGGIGYAAEFGFAFMVYFSLGAVAGMTFLSLTAKIWYQTGVNSISELMHIRYDSEFLRALMTGIIVIAYAVTLIAQLFGIGFIIEGIIGIPMWLGILAVGLFFIVYTILGGMMAIARTDLIQSFVMVLGVFILFFALVTRLLADPGTSFFDAQQHLTIYAGESPDNWGVIALFLIFGLGIAIHPYYVQRVMSAKDVATARLIPAVTAVLLVVFYVLISVIGIIGYLYLPDQVGDTMGPAIIVELIGGTLGALAMMAILAGVQSTTDSLLHIVGSYISQDIYEPYFADGNLSDREVLTWSRIFTAIFGVIVVGFSTVQVLTGEIALIVIIGAYAWGILGGSLFVAIAAGLFWKRATREGALAAVILGFIGGVGGGELERYGILTFDPIFLAVGVSLLSMIIVSLMTEPVDEKNLAQIFDDVEPSSETGGDD